MNLRNFIKISLLAFLMTMSFTATAAITDVLKVGHWSVVSTNTIDDINPCPADNCSYSANEGVSGVIDDWNGGAFATGYGTLGGLIVWGGGHSGYFGNEIYVFSLDTQKWVMETSPVTDPVCDYSVGELQDGSPCSAHTYDYVDYHPTTNSFIMLGSASLHEKGGYGSPVPHLYSFDDKAWRRGASHPSIGFLQGASSAYDVKRDAYWLLSAYNKKFSKYDPNANSGAGQWTEYKEFNLDINAVSEIDPVRDLFVTLINSNKQTIYVHDLNNPSAGGVEVNVTGDMTLLNNTAPGLAWDPVSKKFVGWVGGTSLYTITPPSGDWKTENWVLEKITPAGGNAVNPGNKNSNHTYSRFRYVPSVNAFIVVSGTGRPVYMFKLTDGVNPPPSLNFSASQSSVAMNDYVNLTWSATNADTCSAGGDWSGAKATASSEIVGPITADSSFSLWCSNAETNVNVGRSIVVALNGSGSVAANSQSSQTSGSSSGGGGGSATITILMALIAIFFSQKTRCFRMLKRLAKAPRSMIAISAAVLFILLPTLVSADAQSDFIARATHQDVVFYEDFDAAKDVTDKRSLDGRQQYVTFDSTQLASGTGSIRFEIPSNSSANSSGSWRSNFANDNFSIKFGAGEDVYVQWRQRFSSSMLDTVYSTTDGSAGGWKAVIIGEGDYEGWKYGDAGETGSCTALEIVTNNSSQRMFPQLYHGCGWYQGYYESFGGSDFLLQNAIFNSTGTTDREKYVLYSVEQTKTTSVRSDFPGVAYHPDEWMTFQIRISPGPLGTAKDSVSGYTLSGFTNSTVEMWVARDGKPSVKTHSFTGVVLRRSDLATDTGEKYGKVWLTPYQTNKDASQTHGTAYTWYDELIVSKSKIADPGFPGTGSVGVSSSGTSVNSGNNVSNSSGGGGGSFGFFSLIFISILLIRLKCFNSINKCEIAS